MKAEYDFSKMKSRKNPYATELKQTVAITPALQDTGTVTKEQETNALLQVLSLGNSQIEKGEVTPASAAFAKARRFTPPSSPPPSSSRS